MRNKNTLKRSFLFFTFYLIIVSNDARKFEINVTVGDDYFMYENISIPNYYHSVRISTAQECFNLCKNDSKCSLITFAAKSTRLLDTGPNCYLRSVDQRNVRPRIDVGFVLLSKQALGPIPPYYYKYWGVQLWNHYMLERNVNDENDCFDICLNKSECYAITYVYRYNQTCYFFQKDKYLHNQANEFISMSRGDKLDLKNTKLNGLTVEGPFYYENVRLFGQSTLKQANSAVNCFYECIKDGNKCDAALYGPDNYCSMFKKGHFYIWTNETNWRVMSKERLTEKPNKYRYVGVRLYNQYNYSSASNDECSRRCDSQRECFAVAYRPSSNMGCFFFKKREYKTQKVAFNAEKWEVISKDVISMDEKKVGITTNASVISKTQPGDEIISRPFNYQGIRLTNHYAIYTNINSLESCFKKCTFDSKCFAIGFHQQRILCKLYQNGEFEIESSQEWIVLSKNILELGLNSND